MNISLHSYAKINLALDVGRLRPDGFHDIHTVFLAVDLADRICLECTEQPGIILEVTGDAPDGPENLAWQAGELILQASGFPGGLRISIEKNIPMQAGLGGGSSNAAAVLLGAAKLFGYKGDLAPMALRLGSDAPFFLLSGTAEGRGRGEALAALPEPPPLSFLLVRPDTGVSTAQAYRRLDELGQVKRCMERGWAIRCIEAIQAGDRQRLIESLGNDFERVVLNDYPEIDDIKKRLLKNGAEAALLSGSGSCVFGVFPDSEQAAQAAENFIGLWHAVAHPACEALV